MATANGNTYLKQIKTLPAERINGKVKLPTKAESNGSASANVQNNTVGKGTNVQQGEGLSPEQRRRASGRQLMTPEEQKIQLRRRVEQFIPTINVRNSTTNILAKYKDATPSLVVHLYPTHFRFDQQEGVFSYNSPMKAFLEYIRDEQIPPEVADVFKAARIKYYDACLIVEVRDHRPKSPPPSTSSRGGPFITPSQNSASTPAAPAAPAKEPPRVYKTLLRPTEQSLWMDFGQLADSSGGEFTDWMGLQVEGGLMLAMHPRLVLDAASPAQPLKRIFERVCDQSTNIPPRKKVKRESSKALDDSAERAAEEKMMLLGDLKHDKDFQPRFQILVHKEEWKKKKAEEEKAKAANGTQGGRDFADLLHISAASKPKVTIDSIQAQQQQAQVQILQAQARLPQPPNGGAQTNANQQAAQAQAFAAAQAQHANQSQTSTHQNPQGAQRRLPLPRAGSQDQTQLAAQRAQQQANGMPRQLQPTGPGSQNTPTPMSSSPQVPIQRLPATPRNLPGTPRPPGTPQAQPAQQKHPTPQAMTPVSTHPSPMMKSTSQGDEGHLQQANGTRQFQRGPQQMMNGIPQGMQQQPQSQQSLSITQFMEALKNNGVNITYEQYLSMSPQNQTALTAKVQEYVQRRLAAQQANQPGAQQTVQVAYQQAQTFMQQAQRNALHQPGQTMTPEQQRNFTQARQQVMNAGADSEMLRQQLTSQGRMATERDVQAMFQQQLLARQQAAAVAAQNGQGQQPRLQQTMSQNLKLQTNQPMTAINAQQVQLYRAQQLRNQAVQRNQALNAQNHSIPNPNMMPVSFQQFMNALSPDQKQQFTALDGQVQAHTFQQWLARQQSHVQQIPQQPGPQLQYNPMTAQSMPGTARISGQMVGMTQAQGTTNGGGPAMMRQSTSGGGS